MLWVCPESRTLRQRPFLGPTTPPGPGRRISLATSSSTRAFVGVRRWMVGRNGPGSCWNTTPRGYMGLKKGTALHHVNFWGPKLGPPRNWEQGRGGIPSLLLELFFCSHKTQPPPPRGDPGLQEGSALHHVPLPMRLLHNVPNRQRGTQNPQKKVVAGLTLSTRRGNKR